MVWIKLDVVGESRKTVGINDNLKGYGCDPCNATMMRFEVYRSTDEKRCM